MIALRNAPLFKELTILDISAEAIVRERLLELGFVPGTSIQLLMILPFSGPSIVRAGPLTLALRAEEAACIWVAA